MKIEFSIWKDIYISALSTGDQALLLTTLVLWESYRSLKHYAAAADIEEKFKLKWLEVALNLVKIKNPFGFVQTNPQAEVWWVPLFFSFSFLSVFSGQSIECY